MKDQSMPYTPGVCNINTAEIQKRRKIGVIGLITLLLLLALMYTLALPAVFWALTFIPGFLMATGFLQAKHKFCVGYAAAGMRHTAAEAEKITDQSALEIDKRRAKSINIQALSIGLTITALSVLIALLVV